MAITGELPINLRDKLADALSNCACVSTMAGRQSVVEDLPQEVRKKIPEANDIATGVRNIVAVCSQFPRVIYDLREVIRRLEEPAYTYQNFSLAFAEVEMLFQCPNCNADLPALKKTLDSFEMPYNEVAKLYALCTRGMSKGTAQAPVTLYTAFLELARRSPSNGFALLERVLRHPEVNDVSHARNLSDWIEKSASQFGVESARLTGLRDQIKRETQSRIYVVVKIVENQLLDDTFYVEAWSWRSGEGFSRLEIKSRLSAADHQKFPDVETLLRAAICEAEEKFAAAGLVVEIITERKVFSKDISSWKVDVGEAEGDLLIHHPVIFRWKNRNERPARHQLWREKWQALKKLSDQTGLHDMKWLECETACQPSEIINGWVDADKGLCLALGYKLSEKKGNGDLLETALNVGTPVIFWMQRTRSDEKINEELFKDLLSQSKLIDLPAYVWDLRKQAYKDADHPARRMTLLFDDADRVLPKTVGSSR